METRLVRVAWLGAMVLIGGVLALAPATAGEESKAPPDAQGRDRQVLDGSWVKRIEARIERLKKLDAEHPDSPAEVKAASEKLVADLTTLQANVKKLAADIEAKNWEAVRVDREAVKTSQAAVAADSKTFYELIKKQRTERKPEGGEGTAK